MIAEARVRRERSKISGHREGDVPIRTRLVDKKSRRYSLNSEIVIGELNNSYIQNIKVRRIHGQNIKKQSSGKSRLPGDERRLFYGKDCDLHKHHSSSREHHGETASALNTNQVHTMIYPKDM